MFCKYFFVYVACFHSLTSVFHRTAISGLGAGREGWRSRTSWDRLPGPVKPSGDSVLAEAAETVLQKGNGGRGGHTRTTAALPLSPNNKGQHYTVRKRDTFCVELWAAPAQTRSAWWRLPQHPRPSLGGPWQQPQWWPPEWLHGKFPSTRKGPESLWGDCVGGWEQSLVN